MIQHPEVAISMPTCDSHPEQYEGQLLDGQWFYFRYRFGRASLAVGVDRAKVRGASDVAMRYGDQYRGEFATPAERDEIFAILMSRISAVPVANTYCPPCGEGCLQSRDEETGECLALKYGREYLAEQAARAAAVSAQREAATGGQLSLFDLAGGAR